MTSRTLPASLAVIVVSLALVGCARKTAVVPPPAPAAAVSAPVEAPTPDAPPAEPVSAPAPELRPVFFAFDSNALTAAAREALDADVAMLRAETSLSVIVEGHCDERGTVEYNQALGERRANTARDYLVASGIDVSRIQVISYGRARPFADGSNERAWAQNRRAHLVVSGPSQAADASR